MYKVCSIFSQVLKLFPRGEFELAVKKHQAERHARGFTSWGQFTAMLFCQIGRAHSLREICGGLACCEGHLKHLGVPTAPKRSTLAYANEHRPWCQRRLNIPQFPPVENSPLRRLKNPQVQKDCKHAPAQQARGLNVPGQNQHYFVSLISSVCLGSPSAGVRSSHILSS